MDAFKAVSIIEGIGEYAESDRESVIEAWQHLITSGVVWKLQGYYGRTAADLIQAGICVANEVPAC